MRTAKDLRDGELTAGLSDADRQLKQGKGQLSQLHSRPTTLNEDEIVALRRIIGGWGTGAASRLGLTPDAPYDGPIAAFAAAQRWRRRAKHGLNDPFTTRACRGAVRSAEALVAQYSYAP